MRYVSLGSIVILSSLLVIGCGSGDDEPAEGGAGSAGASAGSAGTAGSGGSTAGSGGSSAGSGGSAAGSGGSAAGSGGSGGGTAGSGGSAAGSGGSGGSTAGSGGSGGGAMGFNVDTGFRPKTDGFSFENYTNDNGVVNMTAEDVRRMFGDTVCANTMNGKCTLTPAASKWMEEKNGSMNGGHCDGMAGLSGLIYGKQKNASDFGGATTPDLSFMSASVTREIAYTWATQTVEPVLSTRVKPMDESKTPNQVLDIIVALMTTTKQPCSVHFFQPGYKGGHAVTAYAVEDKGNDIVNVRIYDNNFPSDEGRAIVFNRAANTWEYTASTNPNEPGALYQGTATTATISAFQDTVRLGVMVCPFCETQPMAGMLFLDLPPAANEVTLVSDGDVNLLVTDENGKRIGYADDVFVKEIPGARFSPEVSKSLFQDDPEPAYLIPPNLGFKVDVDGKNLAAAAKADVSIVGHGYVLTVEDINVDPGQKDTITLSKDGTQIAYETKSAESPLLYLGTEEPGTGADYGFGVAAVGGAGGVKMSLKIDDQTKKLAIQLTGATAYGIAVQRIDGTTDQFFLHEGNALGPNDTAYLDYGAWSGNGGTMPLEIDLNSDGTIDDTIVLTDQN